MYQRRFDKIRNLGRALLLLAACGIATARASDVVNTASVSFTGVEGPITLPTNVVRALNIDPVPVGGTLFVQKTASRDTAEIGDLVDFSVSVKNVSAFALQQTVVGDRLPFGFVLQSQSVRIDGVKGADPQGGKGPDLTFTIGSLEPGRTVTVTYRTRVGVDAFHGDGINRATATTLTTPPATSNLASVRVDLRSGVFSNRGVIIGKVFVDTNRNRIQDEGEPGVPGVRLYIEDGTYVITDCEGKYSFYGLSPRTHTVKLDRTTIPPGVELESLNTRNAGDGGSVFALLRAGEMLKVNFAFAGASDALMHYVEKMRLAAQAAGAAEVSNGLKNNLNRNGTQPLAADVRSLPSSGLLYPGVSVQPTTQDRTQSADSFFLGGPRTEMPTVGNGANMRGFSTVAPQLNASPTPAINALDSPIAALPTVSLEQAMTANANTEPFGFVDLKDHDTLPMTQTNIRVKGVAGGKLSLHVNGREISDRRIGKRVASGEQGIEAAEFIGIELEPGANTLELVQFDQFGNKRGEKTITVIAPDKLGTIRIHTPENATADGKTPARIVVELVDHNGVPVTARTALTLDATLGKWLTPDLNPREPGVQVFIEGGRAEFALAAPVEPGDSHICVSSGILKTTAVVTFFPELRPLLATGLVEGVINISHLSANTIRPVSSRDTFDSELRDFAVHGNDGSAAARAAFFLKGKILGSYLLTAAYDSEKDSRDRLFRDIQPDEFYPVYGDSSVKGFEAQSTGRLYVRVDNKKSYLLYGDFVTQGLNDLQQLGNYNRSLNGVREHFENRTVSANAWASYDNSRQVVEELRANGTSGPYAFHSANGLVNSEKIEILTRDRNNPGLIIKTVEMTRFSDYEFEPLTGQILFKAPVPSLDADLNPISIRVTYEIDQGGDKFWTYGADAQVKLNSRMQIGGAFARDENSADRYALYSGNVIFDLGLKTFLFGEFAHSEDAIEGEGNAGRIELRHNSEKLSARIFWGRADEHFKNQTAILTAGRTEGGAQVAYQISRKLRTIFQAVDTESSAGGTRRGVLVGMEQTFGKDIRLEIDGRYSTETATPASPSTALTVGATPNEVRSVRAKLTLPLPWTEGAGRFYGEYEQDVFEDKRLAAIGGEYQVDAKTRVYLRHEFISSLGGPFELNTVQQQNTTVVGVESTYSKDATLFNEYRARDGFSGREAEAAIGLRNGWTLAEGLRVNTTFERVAPLEGTATTNDSTAVTGALEYTANPDWKGTARVELRRSESVDSLLNTLGFAYKLSDNWTALSKSVLYLAQNKGPNAVDQTQARIQAGLAWRQTSADVWNALGKYEFRTEDGAPGTFLGSTPTTITGGNVQRRINILTLDVNCQPNADWQLSGHYAGKLAFDNSNNGDDVTTAHLFVGHFTHDLTSRIDIGIGASALVSGDGGGVQYAAGPEIGFTVAENLRAALGYNFSGFSDQDLTQEQYTSHGFYLALRLKFDEQLFSRRKQNSLGPPEEKSVSNNK